MYRKLNYDALKDFAPISLVAQVPNVLIVHPSLPVKSLKELAQFARARPGKLSFGSGGVGSSNHLASELFKSLAKAEIVHVPYKGASIALTNIISGEVEMVVVTVPATIPYIAAGRVRGLAVLGPERAATLPNVPTSAEAGMPELVMITWYGLAAPAGVRQDIIDRLNVAAVTGMQTPEVKQRLSKVGIESVTNTPAAFASFMGAEVARWAQVIREAKIQVE